MPPFGRGEHPILTIWLSTYIVTTNLSNGDAMPQFKDSDRYQVIWLIRRLFRALGQASDELLKPRGFSAADRAVMEFLYPDEALSVPEIARKYSVSRQHVQVTVNSLSDKDLVTTVENPRHKRSPLVQLTGQGRRLFASILEQDRQAINALFDNIAPKDARITRSTLQSLLEQLREETWQ